MPWKLLRSDTAGGGGSKRHSVFDWQDPPAMNNKNGAASEEATSDDERSAEQLPPPTMIGPGRAQGRSTTDLTRKDNSRQSTSRDVPSIPRSHRFSLLKLRHASDPQLARSYATSASSSTPPLPHPTTPTIVTTAPNAPPSSQNGHVRERPKRPGHASHSAKEKLPVRRQNSAGNASDLSSREPNTNQRVTFDAPNRFSTLFTRGSPPAYADVSNTSLALPPPRLSDSSKSDGSSGEQRIYAETTTTHTVSTTTTFFRLPRRKKDKGHLFPLPVKIPPPGSSGDALMAPASSSRIRTSISPVRKSNQSRGSEMAGPAPEIRPSYSSELVSPLPSPTHSSVSVMNAASRSPGVHRRDSIISYRSANSSASVPIQRPMLGSRGRSPTLTSLKRPQETERQNSPHLAPSGRTSTSTAGRKSFGDIFSLSQMFRQNSEPASLGSGKTIPGGPATPASTNSKANSFQMLREPAPYPERAEADTPAAYLTKLEEAVNRGVIAAILCKSQDEFSKTCLRKYMRGFSYFGDSIDMAVRKMLMEVELPKETQQIDRLLQGFADRYCECNPGIFATTDEAYFVAFSILLLHSDTHNKNNKRKMQRTDYVKNTQDQVEVSHDILGCFYDNVSYTPFVHFEDEVATNSHRLAVPKPKKGLFKPASTDNLRSPVDPYALILDQKLELLRPSLREVMNMEDTYSTTGTATSLDANVLYEAFYKAGVLQIVSARSRPDAFLSQATISNPSESEAGLVDIKAAKVGLLWRKDPNKKKTRSPWQEWGALLTGSQLYFFRDVAWVKGLMSQHDAHQKANVDGGAVVFKPPLPLFQPNALLSMNDAIALVDCSYKKHKNALLFIKHGGFEEVFLANTEDDMNDWIAKLNYAATFRTAGIRMRGFIGANYEGQRPAMDRRRSDTSAISLRSTRGKPQLLGRQINQQLAGEILTYRRQIMSDRIAEADNKLATTQKELDNLLRNARHLQICSPIQSKTRETLVYAAARMSAKLKWTRVEMCRMRGYRDIMKMDLEQELTDGPAPPISPDSHPMNSTPQYTGQIKSSHQPSRTDLAASPTSMQSGFSSYFPADAARNVDGMPPPAPPASSQSESSDFHRLNIAKEQSTAVDDIASEARDRTASISAKTAAVQSWTHPNSTSGSALVRSDTDSVGHDSGLVTPAASIDDEERILRGAGLIDAGESISKPSRRPDRRPDISESDADPNPPVTPSELSSKELGGVRRSLQRTLRDSPHSPQASQSLRQRKGKESAVQRSPAESLRRSSHTGSEGLARKAGSFTLHGKKASVVTLGSEWQSITTEERLKLRKPEQDVSSDTGGELSAGPSARPSAGEAGLSAGEAGPSTREAGLPAGEASEDESAPMNDRSGSVDDGTIDLETEDGEIATRATRTMVKPKEICTDTVPQPGLATPASSSNDLHEAGSAVSRGVLGRNGISVVADDRHQYEYHHPHQHQHPHQHPHQHLHQHPHQHPHQHLAISSGDLQDQQRTSSPQPVRA